MTGELELRRDLVDETACAMELLGHGMVGDLRDLGIECEPADVARVARALPGGASRPSTRGFRLSETETLRELPTLASGHSRLALDVAARLCEWGEYRRAGAILGELLEREDVRPLVFRHAIDLLNVGHVELVEGLVFDDAFGAPEWLREALSAVEGLLWASFRDQRQEASRARDVQAAIEDLIDGGVAEPGTAPLAQAWSLIDLYASWGEPLPPESVLPRDVSDEGDSLVRALWALRRGRQLIALGRLEQALPLLEAGQSLVECDSIVGSHLCSARYVCRALLGQSVEGEELVRVRRAADFVAGQRLELLAFAFEGYREATLTFIGAREGTARLARLAERSSNHPDPLLGAALRIACAADACRRHSFYSALTYVRDLPLEIDYLGVTDLVCAAYVIEVLCQGALGEEPCALDDDSVLRPSGLDLLPLARTVYGIAQEVYRLLEELDQTSLVAPLDDCEPSYVAAVLADLALKGSWNQALSLGRMLPIGWRRAAEAAAGEPRVPEVQDEPGSEPDGEWERPPIVSPIAVPKLELHMLGAYDIWVGEQRLTGANWRRRAGKTLLAALIVAPGHSLARADLCDIIWPDRDYLSSRNNLYSVLSSTRETLGCDGCEPPYLLCEEGKVRLNPKLMECDVDIFEGRCREVLSHQGDHLWRLGLCRDLDRIYQGGLVVPCQDVRGEFQARRQALESLYVDTLVEATNLALQAGLAKEALWFATEACERSDLREDAYSARMRALAADGRANELDDTYKRYCAELSEGRFVAPSARIRALYAQLRNYVRDSTFAIADPAIEAFEGALGTVA